MWQQEMLVEKEKTCGETFCKVASDKSEKYMKWMDRVELECECTRRM